MNVLKQRLFLNKPISLWLGSVLIMFSGCAHLFPGKNELTYEDVVPYTDIEKRFSTCRGKGIFNVGGELRGSLNFEFTLRGDSTFIQFLDLLGRKTLFVKINNHRILAWDMIHNERYERESILHILPFTEIIRPEEFAVLLWGSIPKSYRRKHSSGEFEFESMSASISFESERTKYGPLVRKIILRSEERRYHVEIEIKDREFDVVFPHLFRRIPDSIPLAQPS